MFLKRESKVNKIADLVRGKSKINFLIKRAQHVVVCTPYLHEYVRKYNLNSTDISSTVNTDIYRPNDVNNKHEELTIGWSGSHSTSPYLLLLEDVLSKIQSKYLVKILVIGDSGVGKTSIMCRFKDETFYPNITMTIGLCGEII